MQFIEALKLRSKLLFLFILITFGLVMAGVIGAMHISSMKKSMDNLYFGSLVPVVELHDIIQTYNSSLAGTIHKSKRGELSPDEVLLKIEHSIKNINQKWRDYTSHFKRDEEMEYVNYAAAEIENINNYFVRIHALLKEGRTLRALNINLLDKRVVFINSVMQKLINYEIEIADYERKKFLSNYNDIIFEMSLFLSLILLAVLVISYNVFRSIQEDHSKLEVTTTKLRRANKKLENVSYTDVLTGLHNRRYFNYIYERELKRAKRSKSYITFMMLDIDYFKQYNDTYGHIEGDRALQSVAKTLKDILKRPSDYIFRLGGEEFGLLLSDTDESNSAALAREICDTIKAKEIVHEGSLVSEYLTLSIGVVCCIADEALDDEVLISRADEMLYEAKESGRDRYIITSNVSAAKARSLKEALIA